MLDETVDGVDVMTLGMIWFVQYEIPQRIWDGVEKVKVE